MRQTAKYYGLDEVHIHFNFIKRSILLFSYSVEFTALKRFLNIMQAHSKLKEPNNHSRSL